MNNPRFFCLIVFRGTFRCDKPPIVYGYNLKICIHRIGGIGSLTRTGDKNSTMISKTVNLTEFHLASFGHKHGAVWDIGRIGECWDVDTIFHIEGELLGVGQRLGFGVRALFQDCIQI